MRRKRGGSAKVFFRNSAALDPSGPVDPSPLINHALGTTEAITMLYQLPTDPGIPSTDPLGILDKEDPSQVEVLSALFETALHAVASGAAKTLIPSLIEDIAYTVHGNGTLDTRGLRNFLSKEPTSPEPFTILLRAAQALPALFSTHYLTTLDEVNDRVEISGSQVNSLLAHQFLGTLTQPQGTDWGRPDFTSWFASEPAHHHAVHGYLRTIVSHFAEGGYDESDSFTFTFYSASNMANPSGSHANPSISFALVDEETEPSDDDGAPFVLVAANAQPGPGPTATQEERLQSASPALSLSALVIPIIPDNAAVVTSAFPVHATWKGHNRTARMGTLFSRKERPKRHYILADALPLDSMPDPKTGLKDLVSGRVEREVKKLYAGFSGASKMASKERSAGGAIIESGPWGCGAFGGTFLVKMLCMQVASGISGVQLRLGMLKDREGDVDDAHAIAERQNTTANLWHKLLDSKTEEDIKSNTR